MIKFDLPIDGVKVATLEELRDHFTAEVIGHFRSGLLARWLQSRSMARELAAIGSMTAGDDIGVFRELCGIFGVAADDDAIAAVVGKATGVEVIHIDQRFVKLQPGVIFRDAPTFPELVVVPRGQFMMRGSALGHSVAQEVRIDYPLAVGVYPVTFDEWDACVSEGGCDGYTPSDGGWGRGDRPVVNVSWENAKMYVEWLSRKSGRGYRLLSESEWEYSARGGATTAYWWGDGIGKRQANCLVVYESGGKTSPVGSFSANAFGLYDVHGNVNEWVEDNWTSGEFARVAGGRTPTDGSPHRGVHPWRVVRGGSWADRPREVRAASRKGQLQSRPDATTGFRVARTVAEEVAARS